MTYVVLITTGESTDTYQFGQGANVNKRHTRAFRTQWLARLAVALLTVRIDR